MRSGWLVVLLAAVVLAGCAEGPKRRVFPPEARLQELQRMPDGSVALQVRLLNYSNVPMRFERLDAELLLDGVAAGRIALAPGLQVAANSVEIVPAELLPPQSVLAAIDGALAGGSGLRYQLRGTLVTTDPRGNHALDFSSTLDRVPGLERVLR